MKVTHAQAAEAVALVICLADEATADGARVNELRLGDAAVRQIVDLRDRIKGAAEAARLQDERSN